jgi:hypothetical protein
MPTVRLVCSAEPLCAVFARGASVFVRPPSRGPHSHRVFSAAILEILSRDAAVQRGDGGSCERCGSALPPPPIDRAVRTAVCEALARAASANVSDAAEILHAVECAARSAAERCRRFAARAHESCCCCCATRRDGSGEPGGRSRGVLVPSERAASRSSSDLSTALHARKSREWKAFVRSGGTVSERAQRVVMVARRLSDCGGSAVKMCATSTWSMGPLHAGPGERHMDAACKPPGPFACPFSSCRRRFSSVLDVADHVEQHHSRVRSR